MHATLGRWATKVRSILAEAMRLAPTERAELASELLASIDWEKDDYVERAWAEEPERRAQRALRGESQGRAAASRSMRS